MLQTFDIIFLSVIVIQNLKKKSWQSNTNSVSVPSGTDGSEKQIIQ